MSSDFVVHFITPQWVLGFMSGTSLDGVDVGLIETDGVRVKTYGPGLTYPYPADFQQQLKRHLGGPSLPAELIHTLTQYHIQAAQKLFKTTRIRPTLAGFHGQTIFYEPRTPTTRARTLQVGDAQTLSDFLQIPVVSDMRQNDIQEGGAGAPLVPIFHKALVDQKRTPIACINIGGIANVSVILDYDLHAADVGPGCALINDWMRIKTGLPMDQDGVHAMRGHIHTDIMNAWFMDDFFAQSFPKALDRDYFMHCLTYINHLSVEDGAATLAAFTAQCIMRHLPTVDRFILCGGGRQNQAIVSHLRAHKSVMLVDELGLSGDLIEAYAWGYLAARSSQGLPLTFPHTTGVPTPTTGGLMFYPHEAPISLSQ